MGLYATYETSLLPPFLRGPWGESWGSCFGLLKDVFAAGALQAVSCRFVQLCPEDGLGFIGDERLLPQNPGESVPAYRARLLAAPELWQWAGTEYGIVTMLHYLGFPNVQIFENADWTVDPSYGYSVGDEWWRFWIVIRSPHGFGPPRWRCGDGSICGSPWLICGFAYSPVSLPAIRPTVARWKPAHAVISGIIVVLSGEICGGGWICGDGTVCGGDTVLI